MIIPEQKNPPLSVKVIKKKSPLREWFDSVLFAVVAATLIRWLMVRSGLLHSR